MSYLVFSVLSGRGFSPDSIAILGPFDSEDLAEVHAESIRRVGTNMRVFIVQGREIPGA